MSERVSVNKAYKMFVGGAFVRSESGRYFQVRALAEGGADPDVVNVPRGSRKDVRDAVVVARQAAVGWAARTAYNKGQILYRLAEVMESRREELVQSLARAGTKTSDAAREVDVAIDRTVYYAGFTDKIHALLASHNPVAGPHFGFSVVEPTGIVGIVAPTRPSLLGLVSMTLPVVSAGNVAIAVAGETDPRTGILWCECLATSDMPGGVVNVLTGQAAELAPVLAKHRDVNGLFVASAADDLRRIVEGEGAESVKRVRTLGEADVSWWDDERYGQGLSWMEPFLESKSVWHPVGL